MQPWHFISLTKRIIISDNYQQYILCVVAVASISEDFKELLEYRVHVLEFLKGRGE